MCVCQYTYMHIYMCACQYTYIHIYMCVCQLAVTVVVKDEKLVCLFASFSAPEPTQSSQQIFARFGL